MFSTVGNVKTASYEVNSVQNKKIIIDAGHGGFDGGAEALDGTLEKDINLKIALKLKEFCKLHGFEVIMPRETDSGTEKDDTASIASRKKSDMYRRLNVITENPDAIFVSIHLNKFTSSGPYGAQVFYSGNNTNSQLLAEHIQLSVKNNLQKDNNRVIKKADSSIFLLKKSHIPSIIVECGFLSNQNDLKLLKLEEYQAKMAYSIFCGILDYYLQENI